MTNYTKRLEEILDRFEAGIIGQGMGVTGITFPECKNQLTRLFRDMVKDAKPAHRHGTTVGSGRFNRGVSEYESNLLKMMGDDGEDS